MQSNRLYTKHRSRIISFNILIFSFTLFLIINFFLIQVIFSDTYQNEISNKTTALRKIKGNRGSIFDINGNLLAYSIEKCRFWVNTKQANNIEEITNFFETKFKDKNKVNYNFKNTKSTYSLIVQDLVSYENQKIIEDSKSIKNLNYSLYKHRLYPYNELAAQVIGFTNNDNHGKYGIEGYFNNILNGTEKLVEFNKNARGKIVSAKNNHKISNGSDIYLTIDVNIQDILQTELKKAYISHSAKSANGIIINPNSGEIIAMASLPDFNLNTYKKLNLDSANYYYTNRVISVPYEPGSTFKIVNMANALDQSAEFDLNHYFCENGEYYNKYQEPFQDHDPYDSLSFSEIFVKSSNIGTIKIFEQTSNKSFYNKMQDFGFGIKTNISLKNENSGDIKSLTYYKNNLRDLASASIGQSILVTNLQLAMAYGSIANGGYLLKPKIIKKISNDKNITYFESPIIIKRNIKKETSKYLLNTLNDVVLNGTGIKAKISGIQIGGKTGTGEIWNSDKNEYSKNDFISSFASIFPLNNPEYVLIVSIEAPSNYDNRWGGETAAPCTKEIIKQILLYDKSLRINQNEKA